MKAILIMRMYLFLIDKRHLIVTFNYINPSFSLVKSYLSTLHRVSMYLSEKVKYLFLRETLEQIRIKSIFPPIFKGTRLKNGDIIIFSK